MADELDRDGPILRPDDDLDVELIQPDLGLLYVYDAGCLEETYEVQFGDWIITPKTGTKYAVPKKRFEDHYEEC